MTPAGWVVSALVVVAVVLVCWGLHADSRERTEHRAVLDELAGDYHSPADRMAAVEETLDGLVAHVNEQEAPPTGPPRAHRRAGRLVTVDASFTTAARDGCTVCRSQSTVTLDGHNGRRCHQHPPRFDPHRAVHLAVTGRVGLALSYCRTEFPS